MTRGISQILIAGQAMEMAPVRHGSTMLTSIWAPAN